MVKDPILGPLIVWVGAAGLWGLQEGKMGMRVTEPSWA